MQEQEITALLAERREEGMDALLRHYGPLMRYVISGILPVSYTHLTLPTNREV